MEIISYNPKLKAKAKELRKNSTLGEALLWNKLKGKQLLGLQFYRQKMIGYYIVDLFCPKLKLIIEIDGFSHNFKIESDEKREKYLKKLGFAILRFQERQIREEIDNVIQVIVNCVEQVNDGQHPPTPLHPSPSFGRHGKGGINKKGFSLLELLIYISLISILTIAMSNVFISVNKGAGNNNARTAVDSNLRFAFEKIAQDVHSASAVITPSAAGATSAALVLMINGNTTTYSVSDGQLQRQVNSSTADTITDASVVVDTTSIPLIFTRFDNTNAVFSSTTASSIQVQMNIKYGGTNPDMQYNQTKKTTILLRQFAPRN